jgi:hypothetical protein
MKGMSLHFRGESLFGALPDEAHADFTREKAGEPFPACKMMAGMAPPGKMNRGPIGWRGALRNDKFAVILNMYPLHAPPSHFYSSERIHDQDQH